jgi:hypothetical protein
MRDHESFLLNLSSFNELIVILGVLLSEVESYCPGFFKHEIFNAYLLDVE